MKAVSRNFNMKLPATRAQVIPCCHRASRSRSNLHKGRLRWQWRIRPRTSSEPAAWRLNSSQTLCWNTLARTRWTRWPLTSGDRSLRPNCQLMFCRSMTRYKNCQMSSHGTARDTSCMQRTRFAMTEEVIRRQQLVCEFCGARREALSHGTTFQGLPRP